MQKLCWIKSLSSLSLFVTVIHLHSSPPQTESASSRTRQNINFYKNVTESRKYSKEQKLNAIAFISRYTLRWLTKWPFRPLKTWNAEKKEPFFCRRGNRSCQSWSLMEWGENSGFTHLGVGNCNGTSKITADCVNIYYGKGCNYLAEPKHQWRSASSFYWRKFHVSVASLRKCHFPFSGLEGIRVRSADLSWRWYV